VFGHSLRIAAGGLGFAGGAQAQQSVPVIGVPHDWQMGFPASYTPLMDKVASLHDLLLVIITLISLFVLGLLIYASGASMPRAARRPAWSPTTRCWRSPGRSSRS
jgi:cytochrome c oxidase subunit 2